MMSDAAIDGDAEFQRTLGIIVGDEPIGFTPIMTLKDSLAFISSQTGLNLAA